MYQRASLDEEEEEEEETLVTARVPRRTGGRPTNGGGGRDGEFAKFRDSRAVLSIRQVCANKNLLWRMDNVADKSTKFNKSTFLISFSIFFSLSYFFALSFLIVYIYITLYIRSRHLRTSFFVSSSPSTYVFLCRYRVSVIIFIRRCDYSTRCFWSFFFSSISDRSSWRVSRHVLTDHHVLKLIREEKGKYVIAGREK